MTTQLSGRARARLHNELFDDTVDNFELICSVNDVKQARKNRKECYNYGVHIISPTLVFNKEIKLKVREAVVQKLQNNLEKDGPTPWDDDIDKVVYESNGFRMNYSRKGPKCNMFSQVDRVDHTDHVHYTLESARGS